jgi:leucyl-tRNA synthetase
LAPITPHICEEIWEKLGFEDFVTVTKYPQVEDSKMNREMELAEEFLINTISDINEILKVTKITPKKVVLYTPSQWKYKLHEIAIEMSLGSELALNSLMKKAMAEKEIKEHSKDAAGFAKKLVDNLKSRGKEDLVTLNIQINEKGYLIEAKDFLTHELKCEIEVYSSDDENKYDPQGKAKFAVPRRPAIFVE